MKRIVYILLLLLCFFNIGYVNADSLDKAYDYTYEEINVDLASKYVILYNLKDNYKLLDIKSSERVQVASLTKIMTCIVAIENINNLDEKISINSNVFSGISEYSKAGFNIGDKVTYRDLLYGAMLPSGADAVNALALLTAPSMSKFIDMMNAKVKELGLEDTHFQNVVGLYDKDNYSSAYDIAQILLYSLNNEKFKTVFTTKEYTLSNGIRVSRSVDYYN